MKKLLIGCGVLVALLLCGVGFLAWRFWGDIRTLQQQAEASITRLNDLQAAHPFDPAAQAHLDTARFARALDLRAQLSDDLVRLGDEMEDLQRKEDAGESDLGVLEVVSRTLKAVSGVLPGFADRLTAAEMSWPEFAWHTRVLWATLYRVSLGLGSPALEPLRDSWSELEAIYAQMAKDQKGLPPLRDLVGEFPPTILAEAEAVMATDLSRVRSGLRVLEIEHLYMMPVSKADDLQYVSVPEEGADAPLPSPEPAAEPR